MPVDGPVGSGRVVGVTIAGMKHSIRPLKPADYDSVVSFALEAWEPVFASFERELGSSIYRRIYPDWKSIQAEAVMGLLVDDETQVWIADDDTPVGFVAARAITEGRSRASEIEMIAVAPTHQRQGIGAALLDYATTEIASSGTTLVAISTGADPGHAPARRLYEQHGFRPMPQVRYYREL